MKRRTWMFVALLLGTRVLTVAAHEKHTPATQATWSVPQTHSARRVYGAPIQPKILGRAPRNPHGRATAHAGYSSHTSGHSRRTPSAHHAKLARDVRDSR